MPFLIVCFMLFFGLAQLYPVVAGLDLSLPSWIVAGLLLAIASNYDKLIGDKRIGYKPSGNALAGQRQDKPPEQFQATTQSSTTEPSSAAVAVPSEAIAAAPGSLPAPAGKPVGKPAGKPVGKPVGKSSLDLPIRPAANPPAKPSISFTIPKRKSS